MYVCIKYNRKRLQVIQKLMNVSDTIRVSISQMNISDIIVSECMNRVQVIFLYRES